MNEHEMKCNTCGQIMDLRDLSQVFAHEECNGIPIDYSTMEPIENSGCIKKDEPTLHTKNCGKIDLN